MVNAIEGAILRERTGFVMQGMRVTLGGIQFHQQLE